MKVTIDGFINYRPKRYEWESEFYFQTTEMQDYGYVTVMPHSIEVDVPPDFDPRGLQIEMLRQKKADLMAEFQKRCTEIEAEISKLTCLEAA